MSDPLTWAIVGRIVERSLIVIGGILAIWFGFRLFDKISKENSAARLEGAGIKFEADRIGPGVFFSLFGALLLGYSLFSEVEVQAEKEVPTNAVEVNNQPTAEQPKRDTFVYSGFGDIQEGKIPDVLKATNTLIGIVERQGANSTEISGIDRERLIRAVRLLPELQRNYIDNRFSVGVYDKMRDMNESCKKNTQRCIDFLNDESNSQDYTYIMDILGTTID